MEDDDKMEESPIAGETRRLAHAPSRTHLTKTLSSQTVHNNVINHLDEPHLKQDTLSDRPGANGTSTSKTKSPGSVSDVSSVLRHCSTEAPAAPKASSKPSEAISPDLSPLSECDQEENQQFSSSSQTHHQFDDASDDDEDVEEYRRGGYHPVLLGDRYKSKYLVVKKLGWGHFSTVWLVEDKNTSKFFAMKIVKSASHYTEAAQDEIKLMREVSAGDPRSRLRQRVMQMIDDFRVFGPFGTHVAMVFEVMGHNLLRLIRHFNYRGLPSILTKRIIKQTLQGLDYLHSKCSIIHTDIKPENILMCLSEKEIHAIGQLAKATYAQQPPPPYANKARVSKKSRKRASVPEQEQKAEDGVRSLDLDALPRIRMFQSIRPYIHSIFYLPPPRFSHFKIMYHSFVPFFFSFFIFLFDLIHDSTFTLYNRTSSGKTT